MKNNLIVIAILSTMALSACNSNGIFSVAPLPDAESEAAQTYALRCGGCHSVPYPQRLSFGGWQKVLPVMEQRIKERKMMELSDDDKRQILNYLKMHSR